MMHITSDSSFPRLVGDVGGTFARFAMVFQADGPVQAMARYRCDHHATLWDALQQYLAEHAKATPRACAIGVATAVTGDEVRLTNHPWRFSIRELQAHLGVERLLVLNDFSALALSLPQLPADELWQVGGGVAVAGAPIALLGPGTGLGVSGLVPMPGGRGYVPISGEGGHVTMGGFDADEAVVLHRLHQQFGHASAERALSGPGLENLHRAVCAEAGRIAPALSAAQVTQAALVGTDADCEKALSIFCNLLGNVAGNLALTLGARGGVYIGGGIVPQLGNWFARSSFRERFESKGRFRDYLSAIPTWVVRSDVSPALIGACRALDDVPAQCTVTN
jgi:glucokinase